MVFATQRLIMTVLVRSTGRKTASRRMHARRAARVPSPRPLSSPARLRCHHPIPMRLPFALAALDWIAPRDAQGARVMLDLDGQRGWACLAAGGYCVATAVQLPGALVSRTQPFAATPDDNAEIDTTLSRWLMRVSLALAGQTELRDDHLHMANDDLWWVHRFDGDTPVAHVEAQLRRQLLACAMLASQAANPAGNGETSPTSTTSIARTDARLPLAPDTDTRALGAAEATDAADAARRRRVMQRG